MSRTSSTKKLEVLAQNIQQGLLSQQEAVFIAFCVDHAIQAGVEKEIGTFGLEFVKEACKARSKQEGESK